MPRDARPWRRAYPIVVGVALLGATVPAILGFSPWGFSGLDVLDCGAPSSVRFSDHSGFYEEPFELTIRGTRGEPIHYTLDGSFPNLGTNPATQVYEGELPIVDRTPEQNLIAPIRTSLNPDAVEAGRMPDPVMRRFVDAEIEKATVVRARTPTGQECVGIFFVGPERVRDGLPVVHISADPDHFFDHETGIYVPGRTFEDHLHSDEFDPEERLFRMPGNYSNRGRGWERPSEDDLERSIVLHYFEPGGELGYRTQVGLRIHGGASRYRPQKSLRIYARNDYGNRVLDYPFFGDRGPDQHRRLILRNSGNDWSLTHLLDGYIHDLVSDLEFDTQAYDPAVVFINGEYWGMKNLRERYDRHYLEINHGADPDNVAILGPGLAVETGDERDTEHFFEILTAIGAAPADRVQTVAEQHLDLENLIDYLILQTFTSNTDWPHNNVRLWRERTEPVGQRGGTRDGRWRWLVFDVERLGGSGINVEHNQFRRLRGSGDDPRDGTSLPYLYTNLMRDEAFQERFNSRFEELLSTTFDPDRSSELLRERAQRVEAEIPQHMERWARSTDWQLTLDRVEEFFRDRPAVIREQLTEEFELDTARG